MMRRRNLRDCRLRHVAVFRLFGDFLFSTFVALQHQHLLIAAAIAVDGATLAAQVIHIPVQIAHLLNSVFIRHVAGLADARIHPALDGGLHLDMLFRAEVHRGDEVIRQFGFARMLVKPLLHDGHFLLMQPQAALAVIRPGEEGFNAGGRIDHRANRAIGGLRRQRDIADAVLAYLLADVLRHGLHKAALDELFRLAFGEWPFFLRQFNRRFVDGAHDKAVQPVDKRHRLIAAITNAELHHQFRNAHGVQADAPFVQLLRPVGLEEVGRGVNDIIEKAGGDAGGFVQVLPVYIMLFSIIECCKVNSTKVTNAISW